MWVLIKLRRWGIATTDIEYNFKPDFSAHSYEDNDAETVTKGCITTITTDTNDL